MNILNKIYKKIQTLIFKNKNYKKNLNNFSSGLNNTPLKIVIGSANLPVGDWLLSDKGILDLLRPDKWKKIFVNKFADAFLAEHVWEHLNIEDGVIAAQTCFDFLNKGGYLRVAVPDGFHPSEEYINYVKPGGNGFGSKDHKVLYNYKTFKDIFERVGFKVDLLEYFDENGNFHYKDWNENDGMVFRSKRFDKRNSQGKLDYTSIILDARK
ncbi:MAG: hypothetical protein PHQ18_03760 [Patescibacteria group bacterium]|nr:hypothetical protein [Patescibacteria group bacterium]